jgi:hypothetical protein
MYSLFVYSEFTTLVGRQFKGSSKAVQRQFKGSSKAVQRRVSSKRA